MVGIDAFDSDDDNGDGDGGGALASDASPVDGMGNSHQVSDARLRVGIFILFRHFIFTHCCTIIHAQDGAGRPPMGDMACVAAHGIMTARHPSARRESYGRHAIDPRRASACPCPNLQTTTRNAKSKPKKTKKSSFASAKAECAGHVWT